jgi:6-phosphogluconolactonase
VSKPEIIICRNPDELNHRAAEQFVALAADAIARAGRFAAALSGGSTPKALYALLASPTYRERVDWSRVHLFWGDERCVPPNHPDSNFRMVQESLLSKTEIPSESIHRMAGEKEPEPAASEYQHRLGKFFNSTDLPRFDLVYLGLGEDGHGERKRTLGGDCLRRETSCVPFNADFAGDQRGGANYFSRFGSQ